MHWNEKSNSPSQQLTSLINQGCVAALIQYLFFTTNEAVLKEYLIEEQTERQFYIWQTKRWESQVNFASKPVVNLFEQRKKKVLSCCRVAWH